VSSFNSISADKLWRLLGVPHGPALVDVRAKEDFAVDPRFIPSAVRRAHATVSDWGSEFAGRSAVVICENGQGLSEGVAAWLRQVGASSAEVLAGGHAAWAQAGLPLVPESKLPPRDPQGRTVWVTRSRPKIDRIACPWLIRRFVDPAATFLFVSPSEVHAVAERFNGAPFDVEGVFWSHRGDRCTFDVLLEATDPSLVYIELDLYWIERAGQDPLRYFNRWPGRCKLIHVKDSLGAPDHRMTEVGLGIIDWPNLLASARDSGAEHFFVEQDDAKKPIASIGASYSYLEKLRLPAAVAHHGRLKQSIARWTMKDVALPDLCRRAETIGFDAIDLLYPEEWQVVREAGMQCSLGYPGGAKHSFRTASMTRRTTRCCSPNWKPASRWPHRPEYRTSSPCLAIGTARVKQRTWPAA